MYDRTRVILSPLAVIAMLAAPSLTHAAAPATTPQDRVEALLGAIQKNDATAFTIDATPAMKSAITPAVIEDLSHGLGQRLAKQHTTTFLCDLKQKGYHVSLWKLSFNDGGDDVMVRLVLDETLLAGFFLQ